LADPGEHFEVTALVPVKSPNTNLDMLLNCSSSQFHLDTESFWNISEYSTALDAFYSTQKVNFTVEDIDWIQDCYKIINLTEKEI
jgi:hypothetical protein